MTTRLFHHASLLIATLVLVVTGAPAQSHGTQTPNTQPTGDTNVSGKPEFRLTLLQTQPQQPKTFCLLQAGSAPTAQAPLVPLVVLGGGSVGRVAKWTGSTLVNSFIGDSNIFEDSAGKVGIGTSTPASPLTVAGMIQTTLGGYKFPDGTVQTTAGLAPNLVVRSLNGLRGDVQLAAGANITITPSGNTLTIAAGNGGIGAVAHNATLVGNGTAASPLGVAVPLALTGAVDQGAIISLHNTSTAGPPNLLRGIGLSAISENGIGLRGESDSRERDAFAVFGRGVATGAYAGWSAGDVNVLLTLTKAAGTFKIDHPLDPENKYLYHSFVESPDMMNIYNGNITTDADGEATVEMPEYFEALNKDFRYQLTVIGQFAQAIISQKIKGNRFVIKTNAPNVEVSWQVTGIRQDAYANKYRIKVEEEKTVKERGYYLHPDVFNQPEERSIEWARDPEGLKQFKQRRLEAERVRNERRPNQR
jgi:hypothetical protein